MGRKPLALGLAALAVALLVLCAGPYLAWPAVLSLIDPVGHPRIPRAALQGVDARSARVLWAQDVSEWAHQDLPAGTVLAIFEAERPDGGRERRVFLNRQGQPSLYLGPLTRQLDGAPVETMFLRVRSLPLILGYFDPAVFSPGGSVTLRTASGIEGERWCGGGALRSMVGYYGFILAIFQHRDAWDAISGLKIHRTPGGSPWEATFRPPLDTRPLWMYVP